MMNGIAGRLTRPAATIPPPSAAHKGARNFRGGGDWSKPGKRARGRQQAGHFCGPFAGRWLGRPLARSLAGAIMQSIIIMRVGALERASGRAGAQVPAAAWRRQEGGASFSSECVDCRTSGQRVDVAWLAATPLAG